MEKEEEEASREDSGRFLIGSTDGTSGVRQATQSELFMTLELNPCSRKGARPERRRFNGKSCWGANRGAN